MKKTLLLGSFAIFGLMANAQLVTEATEASLAAAGLSADAVNIAGGTIFADGEAGTIAVAYDDNWKTFNPYGDYKTVKVGEMEVDLTTGAVGSSNPTFTNYASGVMDAGAVFEIKPTVDGWLTVFTKMNPNKQYVVFEGHTVGLSYKLGYTNGETKIEYTLPYDPETFAIDFADYNVPGHVDDMYDDETSKFTYFVAAGGALGTDEVKPNFPWKVVGLDAAPSENTGFLTFNVLGGNTYFFSALGSKAALGTFVLTEGDVPPTVTFLATEERPAVTFEPGFGAEAGVESLTADPYDVNAPVYNVLGQKVSNDAKGILIQNGKKFIRR